MGDARGLLLHGGVRGPAVHSCRLAVYTATSSRPSSVSTNASSEAAMPPPQYVMIGPSLGNMCPQFVEWSEQAAVVLARSCRHRRRVGRAGDVTGSRLYIFISPSSTPARGVSESIRHVTLSLDGLEDPGLVGDQLRAGAFTLSRGRRGVIERGHRRWRGQHPCARHEDHAAVEDRGVVEADPAEHPPHPGGPHHPGVVVEHDHGAVVADAELRHRPRRTPRARGRRSRHG